MPDWTRTSWAVVARLLPSAAYVHRTISAGLFAVAVCGSATAARPGTNDQAAAPVKEEQAAGFLAIGLPSSWERGFYFLDLAGLGPKMECSRFALQSELDDKATLVVTTTGIAGARLLRAEGDQEAGCPAGASVAPISLHGALEPRGRAPLWLIAPARAFPLSGEVKGALVVSRRKNPDVPIPLELRRQPPSPFLQAVQWFVGVLLPTLLTGYIAYFFTIRQKRIERAGEEDQALTEFRTSRRDRLNQFFAGLYHNLRTTDDNPAARMMTELTQEGIMSALPAKTGGQVTALVRRAEWRKLDNLLAKVFPDQKAEILGSKQGDR